MKHEAWAISAIYLYTHNKNKMTTMAKQAENGDESYNQKLQSEVKELLGGFEVLDDKPADERERKLLTEISKLLKQILHDKLPDDGKEVKDGQVLPQSKKEELHNLVPLLRAALVARGAASSDHCKWPHEQQDAAQSSGKPASTGCIPCTPRASKQQLQSKKQQQQEKEEGVSLTLLLWLTKNVLEPEQFYEWTTSYVDEERIYGWDKEAGEVIDALVAPDGGSEHMFRAAGIAGIHGSGKTALAQKVFVHDKAKDNFALRLWVCVGPPDSEDRFNLLYRMLDNLGLDTAKVEDIVDKSNVVTKAKDEERKRIMEKPEDTAQLRKKAAEMVAKRRADAAAGVAGQNQAAESAKKEASSDDAAKEEENVVTEAGAGAGASEDANKKEEDLTFEELIKEKIDNSRAVETSKIGVLLYILNMTLSKTSYMIVFDDMRAYRRDDDDDSGCWYSNLMLVPPAEGEWGDRLAYGLPKGREHRGAVLVTCRKEDDAKTMARTGLVVRPPKLQGDDAWKLFRREYDQAKKDQGGGKQQQQGEEDLLIKQLEEMKEDIVNKCLGLPVAIIEAARGFAVLDPLPELPSPMKEAAEEGKPPAAAAGGHTESSKDMENKQLPQAAPAGAEATGGEPDNEDK